VDDPVGRELCRGCTVVDFFSDGRDVLIERGSSLVRLSVADGAETPLIELEGRKLIDTDLSRDDSWLAVLTGEADGTVAIRVAPVATADPNPDSWIEIAAGRRWYGAPRWSTDGNVLFYLSDQDDFICVWGQHLDQGTRVPRGEPFAVVHAHNDDMQLLSLARFMWTLEVGGDRLVFNAGTMSGDVYTAMLEPPQ
jgi:hypothetical protein